MASKENEPSEAEEISSNTFETTTQNPTGENQRAESSATDEQEEPEEPYTKNYLRISNSNCLTTLVTP